MEDITHPRCGVDGCIVRASYDDEHGNKRSLCAIHAYKAGTLAKPYCGASKVACRAWDRLQLVLGRPLQHIHFVPGQDVPSGLETVVPGTRYKPDARDPLNPMILYEFLGNLWHGYPPEHDRHLEYIDQYNQTMDRLHIFKNMGYKVMFIWEHEFKEVERVYCPKPIMSIIHEL